MEAARVMQRARKTGQFGVAFRFQWDLRKACHCWMTFCFSVLVSASFSKCKIGRKWKTFNSQSCCEKHLAGNCDDEADTTPFSSRKQRDILINITYMLENSSCLHYVGFGGWPDVPDHLCIEPSSLLLFHFHSFE